MSTLLINTLSDPRVTRLLESGAIGIIPTDTIYGLVAQAANESAVERLYKLKRREHKPGTIIAANIDQLIEIGIKARYLKAVEQFWPNPISIEIPNSVAYLNQGTGRQAFRIVKSSIELISLLKKVGPLLTSSANQPGEPPSNKIAEAQKYFGDRADFYVEGGDLSHREPSTVIRIVDDAVEILRPGAVTIDEQTGRIIK